MSVGRGKYYVSWFGGDLVIPSSSLKREQPDRSCYLIFPWHCRVSRALARDRVSASAFGHQCGSRVTRSPSFADTLIERSPRPYALTGSREDPRVSST